MEIKRVRWYCLFNCLYHMLPSQLFNFVRPIKHHSFVDGKVRPRSMPCQSKTTHIEHRLGSKYWDSTGWPTFLTLEPVAIGKYINVGFRVPLSWFSGQKFIVKKAWIGVNRAVKRSAYRPYQYSRFTSVKVWVVNDVNNADSAGVVGFDPHLISYVTPNKPADLNWP